MLPPSRFSRNLFVVSCLLLGVTISCSRSPAGRGANGSPAAADKPLPVSAVSVRIHPLRRTVESVGSLYAYEEVMVSSEVEGKCERVLVDVGDRVKQGQVLVEISPVELALAAEQQKAAMEQARARLGLSATNGDLQEVTETAAVKKAAADLADAQQKFERSQELSEQGLLPRQQFEEAQARHQAAQANYDLALQDVRNLQAALKQYRATSELAQKKLRDATIRAPFNAYVKQRTVAVGQYVKVQTPVLTLVDVDPLRARLNVPEKMAGWIPLGQMVSLSVEAYADRTFTGKISRINPSVDPQTRMFEVEALVDNHEGVLKPGFFVKARIASSKVEEVRVLPRQAVYYLFGFYRVFRLNGNKVEEKEVRMGEPIGNEVEIVEGLSKGDQVALPLDSREVLRDGAAVEVVP